MNKNASKQSLGKKGEELALNYLLSKGYTLLERNYRYKRSEIDLILQSEKTLVFVEVKFRSTNKFGFPESFVSDNQKRSIIDGAEQYINDHDWQANIRFDIIAVDGQSNIEHFADAFY